MKGQIVEKGNLTGNQFYAKVYQHALRSANYYMSLYGRCSDFEPEDVAQQVVLKLYETRFFEKEYDPQKSSISTIVHYKVRNFLSNEAKRRSSRFWQQFVSMDVENKRDSTNWRGDSEGVSYAEFLPSNIASPEVMALASEIIMKLPDEPISINLSLTWRQLVLEIQQNNTSHVNLAHEYGITPQAIRFYFKMAMERLRRVLEPAPRYGLIY